MAKKTLQLDTDTGNIEATSASSGGPTAITIDGKTGAYTVVAGDLGKVINCTTNTFTVTLTAAATLGAGFWCWVWNTSDTSTHVITIDPNASETIDGVATLKLYMGEGLQIICNGTNWLTGDKKTMRGYAENIISTAARPVATGLNAIALTPSSVAIGELSTAISGAYSRGYATLASSQGGADAAWGAYGSYAIAMGYRSSANGEKSVSIGGHYSNSSGSAAVNIGTGVATGAYAVNIGGWFNTASGIGAFTSGFGAIASTQYKIARSAGYFGAYGDAQTGQYILRKSTTNNTASVLTTDTYAADTTNIVILANDTTYSFTALVVARRTDADNESAGYEFKGVVDRNGSAATTSFVGAVTKTVLAEDTSAWECDATIDTTNGGLTFTVTGETGKTIRWVATVWTTEVSG